MSLRARMGLAAGVAVAVAVIAVAFSAYAGTRSQLHAARSTTVERELTSDVLHHGAGGPRAARPATGPVPARQRPGATDGRAARRSATRGSELDGRGPGFGGAAGIITVISANGNTYVPASQSYQIPTDAQMQALAKSRQRAATPPI